MFKKDTRIKVLEEEIDDLTVELRELESDSSEYLEKMDTIGKLSKMLAEMKSDKTKISPDAVLSFVSSILGILMILKHEELNVISSKALSFVPRMNLRSKK